MGRRISKRKKEKRKEEKGKKNARKLQNQMSGRKKERQ